MVVLERVFDTDGDVIRLEIHKPELDRGSYRCDYTLSGAVARQYAGWGVDPVQALLLALAGAHVRLLAWRRDTGPLTFLKSRDLDMPLPDNATPADFDAPPD